MFFFQELNNMFSDFCATCIVKQNSLLCCPGLAYGRTVPLAGVISNYGCQVRSWVRDPWDGGHRHWGFKEKLNLNEAPAGLGGRR